MDAAHFEESCGSLHLIRKKQSVVHLFHGKKEAMQLTMSLLDRCGFEAHFVVPCSLLSSCGPLAWSTHVKN